MQYFFLNFKINPNRLCFVQVNKNRPVLTLMLMMVNNFSQNGSSNACRYENARNAMFSLIIESHSVILETHKKGKRSRHKSYPIIFNPLSIFQL